MLTCRLQQTIKMTPWKLTTELNKTKYLFSKVLHVDYLVNTFTCSCGHVSFLLSYTHDEVEYACPICENKTFYDANLAWKNMDFFLSRYKDIELDYNFDISTCKEKISARCITTIPKNIDFLRKKVSFDKKEIYSLTLFFDGDIKEKCETKKDDVMFKKLTDILIKEINTTPEHFRLPNSEDEIFNLDNTTFFLKNPHLKEFDFYHWTDVRTLPKEDMMIEKALKIISHHRKEKSVIKAVYKNYCFQIEENYIFTPSLVEIFTKEIKDPNLLCQLLKFDIYDIKLDETILISFIKILKQRYSEKQIVSLFEELTENFASVSFFSDMMYAVLELDTSLKNHKNIKCNIQSLHDVATEHRRKIAATSLADKKIFNSKYKLKACVNIDEYTIKLPKDGAELLKWADALRNCVDGYLDMIIKDETLIYGFFIGDEIDFAVEIYDSEIVQASRVCNQELLSCQQDVLKKWLKRYFPQGNLDYVA